MFCATDLGLDTSECRIARGAAGYIWTDKKEEPEGKDLSLQR